MSISLKLEQWSFWSPATEDPLAWTAEPEQSGQISPRDVPGDLIPSVHRRRMSTASKMSVHAGLKAVGDSPADYYVFSSRHGEVDRSEVLIDEMMGGKELSPTDFSLSVHNTAAGLYSIITQRNEASTSIAAGTASFAMAWLEAEAFVAERPASRVLLVDHLTSLPNPLRRHVAGLQACYAIAIVLSASADADAVSLELMPASGPDEPALGIAFLKWWLGAEPSLSLTAENQGFRWSR